MAQSENEAPPPAILNDLFVDAEIHHRADGVNKLDGSVLPPKQFALFSQLPTELRMAIWRHALERFRKITIHAPQYWESPPGWIGEYVKAKKLVPQSIEKSLTEYPCLVLVYRDHRPSPLLSVSREARMAALKFYRVNIFQQLNEEGEGDCLYINPEFDLLTIDIESSFDKDREWHILLILLSRLAASDPQKIGIRNLGLFISRFFGVGQAYRPGAPLLPEARAAFASVLRNIWRVVFVSSVFTADWSNFKSDAQWKLPLMANAETFYLAGAEPRSIGGMYGEVWLPVDTRVMLDSWQAIESFFSVHRSSTNRLEYQLMLATRQAGDLHRSVRIQTRSQAGEAVIRYSKKCGRQLPFPAFGFWLFSENAMREFHVVEDNSAFKRYSFALTKQWPRLGLHCFERDEKKNFPRSTLAPRPENTFELFG